MEPGTQDLIGLLQGGGNLALATACVFIWRATEKLTKIAERLARIEKALELEESDTTKKD